MSGFITQFENSCRNYSNNTAIIYNKNEYSYKQLKEAINRFARGLIDSGFQKGDRIALILPNYVQFPICYYAILQIGAVAFPINFMFDQEQISELLTQAKVNGIITWEKLTGKIHSAAQNLDLKAPFIVLGKNIADHFIDLTKLMKSSQQLTEPVDTSDEDLAAIVHSAATTGEPKAVELSHNNLYSSCLAIKEQFYITSNDCFITALPMFHPLGLTAILNTCFCFGSKINIHTFFEPQTMLDSIKNNGVTFFIGMPAIYKAFLNLDAADDAFNNVRCCISTWQPLSNTIPENFENKFNKTVYEAYGLAEATALVTANRINHEKKPGSVGLPLNQIAVKIVDEQDNDAPIGEAGEIAVYGPNIMKGYAGQPEAPDISLNGKWLHTGDIGKLDESGNLYFIERKDFVITKGGFHVYPEEIEAYLYKHPKIKDVVVIGYPDRIQGEEVKACIVPKADEPVTSDEIIEYCREAFAVYKCPKIVQLYKNFPKSSTGKTLRYKLKQE